MHDWLNQSHDGHDDDDILAEVHNAFERVESAGEKMVGRIFRAIS
jgi:hypothetical protein